MFVCIKKLLPIWLIAAVSGWNVAAAQSEPVVSVRVAIVAYEDFHSEIRRMEDLLAAVAQANRSLQFQIAAGSYADVAHWMQRGLVDVAIMTPGVFARMISAQDQPGATKITYLATIQHHGAQSPLASTDRQEDRFHGHYRSQCLVPDSSSIQTVDDLRQCMREDSCELLFVHPLSASGYLVPRTALLAEKIPIPKQPSFTFSHSRSIRTLEEAAGQREVVAFVWDDALSTVDGLNVKLRKIPFPELDGFKIPHDVVAVRSEYPHLDKLRALFVTGVESGIYRLKFDPLWKDDFADVRQMLQQTNAFETELNLSVNDIGDLLLQFSNSQPQPPRLAVVLSGGGAKCSYQVGVISALEQKLAQLRAQNPDHPLDIGLVVGTSGGAINSIPIALGVTRTSEGRRAFAETWTTLDQREIVRPSWLIRGLMGLWFAAVQAGILIVFVRRFEPREERRGRLFAFCFAVLAAIEIAIGYIPGTPWSMLGTNHIVHHAWLWLTFGVRTSAWTLLIVSLAALGWQRIKSRKGNYISIPRWLTTTTLLVALLGIPLLQSIIMLAFEDTLSGGQGIERAISTKLPALVDVHLKQQRLPDLEERTGGPADTRLKRVSREIISRGLLQRDLVITGSCLSKTDSETSSDLYFFARGKTGSPEAPFDASQSLEERPELLLDVVLGSGSIFPLFPARVTEDFPREGEQVELVDGGFAHNSPVEAAVLWGATHIVLVEATPRQRSKRGNLAKNLSSSFRHLHQQAQLLDARSREKVIVFSISPEEPHICVLDFADNLITDSIQRGYRDSGVVAPELGRFRQELGEPVFTVLATGP